MVDPCPAVLNPDIDLFWKQLDPDQQASVEAPWSGSTLLFMMPLNPLQWIELYGARKYLLVKG